VDKWDKARVEDKIKSEDNNGTIFVLPLASIIETGNHISQASCSRWNRSVALADLMRKSADEQTPWAAFADQTTLWSPDKLKNLADSWPHLAVKSLSLGDATIMDVAEHYAQTGYTVEILTGDQGLKTYEAIIPTEIPRRRKKL
jgi:hypothetical protein